MRFMHNPLIITPPPTHTRSGDCCAKHSLTYSVVYEDCRAQRDKNSFQTKSIFMLGKNNFDRLAPQQL